MVLQSWQELGDHQSETDRLDDPCREDGGVPLPQIRICGGRPECYLGVARSLLSVCCEDGGAL
jgi:hypothetical protein